MYLYHIQSQTNHQQKILQIMDDVTLKYKQQRSQEWTQLIRITSHKEKSFDENCQCELQYQGTDNQQCEIIAPLCASLQVEIDEPRRCTTSKKYDDPAKKFDRNNQQQLNICSK